MSVDRAAANQEKAEKTLVKELDRLQARLEKYEDAYPAANDVDKPFITEQVRHYRDEVKVVRAAVVAMTRTGGGAEAAL